jgi:hypothetical protein
MVTTASEGGVEGDCRKQSTVTPIPAISKIKKEYRQVFFFIFGKNRKGIEARERFLQISCYEICRKNQTRCLIQ